VVVKSTATGFSSEHSFVTSRFHQWLGTVPHIALGVLRPLHTGRIIGNAKSRRDKVAASSSTRREQKFVRSAMKIGISASEDMAPPHLVQVGQTQTIGTDTLRPLGTRRLSKHGVKVPQQLSHSRQVLYNPGIMCSGLPKRLWKSKMMVLLVLVMCLLQHLQPWVSKTSGLPLWHSRKQSVSHTYSHMPLLTWKQPKRQSDEQCLRICRFEFCTTACTPLVLSWEPCTQNGNK